MSSFMFLNYNYFFSLAKQKSIVLQYSIGRDCSCTSIPFKYSKTFSLKSLSTNVFFPNIFYDKIQHETQESHATLNRLVLHTFSVQRTFYRTSTIISKSTWNTQQYA